MEGVPLFKDKNDLVSWPTLGRAKKGLVFIAGLITGKGKPDSPDIYFKDFIEEWKILQKEVYI